MHLRAAFSDDLITWSQPVSFPVARYHGHALWAPVLFQAKDGSTWLFYAESTHCKKPPMGYMPSRWAPGGDIRLIKSWDGVTWTMPTTIYPQTMHGQIPKVIANPPIQTAAGAIVLPVWRERPSAFASCKTDSSVNAGWGVLASSDNDAPHPGYRASAQMLLMPGPVPLPRCSSSRVPCLCPDAPHAGSRASAQMLLIPGPVPLPRCSLIRVRASAQMLLIRVLPLPRCSSCRVPCLCPDAPHPGFRAFAQRVSGTWLIEGAVAETSRGKLLQLFRSKLKRVFAASSDSEGPNTFKALWVYALK
ncbi:hypothetical protein CYMTET_49602, partial [Cymbomonas tetramitiformis]